MALIACSNCGAHVPVRTCTCPNCGEKVAHCTGSATRLTAAALLLGLTACADGTSITRSTGVDYGGTFTYTDLYNTSETGETDVDTDADADTDADTDLDLSGDTGA